MVMILVVDDDDDDDDIVGARGLGAGSRADPAAAPPQGIIADGSDGSHWVTVDDKGNGDCDGQHHQLAVKLLRHIGCV